MEESLLNGGIRSWLRYAPVVCLKAKETGLFFRRKFFLIGHIKADFNSDIIDIVRSSKETWVFEWLDDGDTCYIRTSGDVHHYWTITDENGVARLVLQKYTTFDKNGPFNETNGIISRPVLFRILFFERYIVIQDTVSGKYIQTSYPSKGAGISGTCDNIDSLCHIEVASKIAIYVKTIKVLPKVFWKATPTPITGYNIAVFSLLPDRRETFFLYPKSNFFHLQASTGRYVCVEGGKVTTTCIPNDSCQIRLGVVKEDDWTMTIWDSSLNDFTQILLKRRNLFTSAQIKEKDLEHAKQKSIYTIAFIPERKEAAKDQANASPLFYGDNSIEDIAKREGRQVPSLVESLVNYIKKYYDYEGLFRLCGSKNLENQAIELLDSGVPFNLIVELKPQFTENEACSLLKFFLKCSLLLSNELHQKLKHIRQHPPVKDQLIQFTVADKAMEHYQSQRNAYRELLQKNPITFATVGYLCEFINYLGTFHQQNKLTATNISIVVMPCFIQEIDTTDVWRDTFLSLVGDYNGIFK